MRGICEKLQNVGGAILACRRYFDMINEMIDDMIGCAENHEEPADRPETADAFIFALDAVEPHYQPTPSTGSAVAPVRIALGVKLLPTFLSTAERRRRRFALGRLFWSWC